MASCLLAALWLVPLRGSPPARGTAPHAHSGASRGWIPGAVGIRARRRWGRRRRSKDPRDDAALIGAALTSVAARLRAGQAPDRAWEAVAATLPARLADSIGQMVDHRLQSRTGRGGAGSPALAAALAATHLAHVLGAELAPVLESAAAGIEEAARARAERETALAGPRATARLLLALPALGLIVGALIGARPWELLTSTIWGGLLLLTAAGLVLLGRWWITRLIARAEQEGAT